MTKKTSPAYRASKEETIPKNKLHSYKTIYCSHNRETSMIRHILFWKYTDTVKAEHKEAEALAFLQKSVATMVGHIDGLRCAEINANTAGGEYDLVFYSELRDADALQAFQNHPLHIAHRERCKALVTDRLCGDMEAD